MASACAVRKYVAGSGCSVPCSSAARPLGKHLHQRRQHCIVGGGARRHGPHGVRARREADQRDQKDGEERDAVVHRLCSLSLSLCSFLFVANGWLKLLYSAMLCSGVAGLGACPCAYYIARGVVGCRVTCHHNAPSTTLQPTRLKIFAMEC
jgi:hypothetical protein